MPGGRFNELYGWDSYFIGLGLLQDHCNDLARGLADNLLYEIQYYGKFPTPTALIISRALPAAVPH